MPTNVETATDLVKAVRASQFLTTPSRPELILAPALLLRGAHVLEFLSSTAVSQNPLLGLGLRELLECCVNAMYVVVDETAAKRLAGEDAAARRRIIKSLGQEDGGTPPAVLDIEEFAAGFGRLSFQSRLDKVADLLPDSQDRVRLRALYQSVSNFDAHGSFAAAGKYISAAPLVFEATPVCGDPAAMLDVGVALLGFTWEIVIASQRGSLKV